MLSRNLHTLEIRFGKLASMVLRFGRRIKFIGFSESIGDVAADDAAELGLMQKQNSQRNISHNGYQRRARLDCKQNTTTYDVRL